LEIVMRELEGRTAFITGGANGVGFGMAHAFLGAGMNVVVADIREDQLDAALGSLQKVGDNVHGIVVDVTDRKGMADAADETQSRFGKVHMLCNNAGINVFGPVESASFDDWDWIMDVNLNSVFNGIKAFLPKIQVHGEGGHIVNTASMASIVSGPGAGIYTAAKFAVRGLSECLWYTLIQQGISVSVVCPGLVNSNIHRSEELRPDSKADSGYEPDPEFAARLEDLQKRGMDPLEIGERILRGVLKDDLYIMTHAEHRDEVVRDFAEIVAAFPDEEAEPERVAFEQFRQKTKYDIKQKFAGHDDE
jgi:NAD(P)-dependent dehydrogenase (short-subunit alcohol dehydrogenase family)